MIHGNNLNNTKAFQICSFSSTSISLDENRNLLSPGLRRGKRRRKNMLENISYNWVLALLPLAVFFELSFCVLSSAAVRFEDKVLHDVTKEEWKKVA